MIKIKQTIKKVTKKETRQKKYNILSQEVKKLIFQSLKQDHSSDSFKFLSQRFQTSKKNLNRWLKNGVDRKPGCGRKKLNYKAEKKLKNWVIEQSLSQGKRVSRSQLQDMALLLYKDINFKASKAWQDDFVKNYDIKFKVKEALQLKKLNQLQDQMHQKRKQIKKRGIKSVKYEKQVNQSNKSNKKKLQR